MVEIRYGEYSEQAELAGNSIAEAREQYQLRFNIPDKAKAYLNGKQVKKDMESNARISDCDELSFKEGSKVPVLLIALLAALAVTGGMFAYTFFTATTTIGVTAGNADFAEVSSNMTVSGWSAYGYVTGAVTTGDLFTIDTEPCSYTGDFIATVYLSNAQQLAKVYRVLVLKLEIWDNAGGKVDINGDGSVDAAGHEDYALLTLRNGACDMFVTQPAPPSSYNVKLAGGFYRTNIWGTGWTGGYQSPQLLIEVAQR
jgi:hypothetical protein